MRSRASWRWSTSVGVIAGVVTLIFLNATPAGVGASDTAGTPASCGSGTGTTTTSTSTTSTSTTSTTSPVAPTTTTTSTGSGLAGTAGTDTSLPCTASVAHASGSGPWSGLAVTVNQTADLVNQTISITWRGGAPTVGTNNAPFSGSFGGDYLQIMQCWGDDGTHTGPPPEGCEFGGQSSSGGQATNAGYPTDQYTQAFTRTISSGLWTCPTGSPPACKTFDQEKAIAAADPAKATFDQHDETVVDPFVSVDGTVVPESIDDTCCLSAPPWVNSFDSNPFFSHNTTNEVNFARTYPDGTGQQLFQVDTGLEAPGLGCGQQQTNPDGSTGDAPKCWLVIVPRGRYTEENPPGESTKLVDTSPLSSTAWANRIAIPLIFQPIGAACSLDNTVRRIVGGELAARAVASWQPTLCSQSGAPSYDYAAVGDDSGRTQLQAGTGAGLAIVTRPVDPASVPATAPLVYAPMTLSGLVVGFSVQRRPGTDSKLDLPFADEVPLYGRGVTKLNLTPRLVAKLLTESYAAEFPLGQPKPWVAHNPNNLAADPDFLAMNPEFSELTTLWRTDTAQLVVEEGSSDAAYELWQWILADPAAKAWLAGQPDPWGMTVNPYYNTDPAANPSGSGFATSPVSNFPKNDPYCFTPTGTAYLVGSPPADARPLCFQDWSPYQLSMNATASATAAANSGAKTQLNQGAPNPNAAWSSNGPQVAGSHFILSVTTSDQAAQFGLQTASLSQAGDDGANPTFIAPDANGLLAGEASMSQSAVPGVLLPNPPTTATGAYPLTLLTYAAAAPVGLDAAARSDFASFLRYGAGAGQTPGTAAGSLPAGYVPLPSSLADQAIKAAELIKDPTSLEPTTTTTAAATTTSTQASPPTTTRLTPTTLPVSTTAAPPTTVTPTPVTSAPAARGSFTPLAQPRASASSLPTTPTTQPRSSLAPPPTANVPAVSPSSQGRTAASGAGLSRYAFVIALLVGLLSTVSAQLLIFRR